MDFKNRWKDVDLNYQKPSQDELEEMMEQIDIMVQKFCKNTDFNYERIKVNMQALEDVVVRTDMRILYFTVFHQGMKPNEYKRITGLMIFWILKRHPFWVDFTNDEDDLVVEIASHINEKIAVYIAITLLSEYNSDFFDHGEDLLKNYTRELEYSFTYRDLSKESLFLMFDPFYFNYVFSSSYQNGSISF